MQACFKIAIILIFMLFISFKSVASSITYSAYPNTILAGDTSEKDVKKAANKIANRASLYSAILPGMGQAYNKKYWKIPIIYAALGAFGYFIATNNSQVQNYHNELDYRYSHALSPNPANNDKIQNNQNLSASDINTLRLDARKYLDFCIIGASLVYILNIIDANVDGHFRTFDINDKLSLSIKPKSFYCIQNSRAISAGLSLTLNFKK